MLVNYLDAYDWVRLIGACEGFLTQLPEIVPQLSEPAHAHVEKRC